MNREKLSLMTFSFGFDILTKKMTIEDSFMLPARAGLHYVDVMNVKDEDISLYQNAMKKTGVEVYCYICSLSFFSPEDMIREELDRQFSIATSLNAKLVMIVPYKSATDMKTAKKVGRDRTREIMVKGYQLAVEKGREKKMQVCFETTPHDVLCLSGNDDCKYVLERVPGLGFVFDSANMLPHGDKTMEAYELLKDFIIHVHLKDVKLEKKWLSYGAECAKDGRVMKVCVWGEGVIPIHELYKRMVQDGYQGNFAIEYAHPPKIPCALEVHEKQLDRYHVWK